MTDNNLARADALDTSDADQLEAATDQAIAYAAVMRERRSRR
jgi:hypothetical protein